MEVPLIGAEGGDSYGISVTGVDPGLSKAKEAAHRTPRGKRPIETEINIAPI